MRRATPFILLALAIATLPFGAGAVAQGDLGRPDGASRLPDGGSSKSLTVPGTGGVADTGLGGTTGESGIKAGTGQIGTGRSVDGPAGQGIGGRGLSGGADAGAGKAVR